MASALRRLSQQAGPLLSRGFRTSAPAKGGAHGPKWAEHSHEELVYGYDDHKMLFFRYPGTYKTREEEEKATRKVLYKTYAWLGGAVLWCWADNYYIAMYKSG